LPIENPKYVKIIIIIIMALLKQTAVALEEEKIKLLDWQWYENFIGKKKSTRNWNFQI